MFVEENNVSKLAVLSEVKVLGLRPKFLAACCSFCNSSMNGKKLEWQ